MDVYEKREFCYFLVLFFVDQLFWRFYCSCGNEGFLCGGKGGRIGEEDQNFVFGFLQEKVDRLSIN